MLNNQEAGTQRQIQLPCLMQMQTMTDRKAAYIPKQAMGCYVPGMGCAAGVKQIDLQTMTDRKAAYILRRWDRKWDAA
jgi:hypothetical protein